MRDFPGGLVVKTPHSRGRELDSILGQGSRFPHAAAKDPEFCNLRTDAAKKKEIANQPDGAKQSVYPGLTLTNSRMQRQSL